MEAAERGLDESTSAFIAWAAKHDIDARDREATDLQLELGVVEDTRKKFREGFELWKSADLPEERYRMATVRYKKKVDKKLRSIGGCETTRFAGTAWRLLD